MVLPRVNPGEVLGGKYRVERVLGAGGMGVVVAARHINLGQRVALKFMLPESLSDPAHAERFLREAKAAVQLKSIHTARVLDVGRLKNNEPFMVMEYLEGRDLDAEIVARGALPVHVAVDYILQASEALAEAHALGMIHRDVKLKNMFLTSTVDGRPLVKVLDFGLAKQLGGPKDVSLTATNSVFGSPQYMSPEQMRSAKDVDTRSDVWSIGICLFELLTGRLPFDATGVAEICAMVLKDEPPPPSTYVRGIPSDLEAVVLRALEKNPDHRFQSVAEFAMALQPYAADEGSARRIVNVMQSAQKNDFPTTSSGNPGWDGGPKTLNAWDSGGPTTPRRLITQLSKRQMGGAVLVLAGLAALGTEFAWTALRQRTPPQEIAAGLSTDIPSSPGAAVPTQAASEPVATSSTTAAPAPPPPTASPTQTPAPPGTVLGASEPDAPGARPSTSNVGAPAANTARRPLLATPQPPPHTPQAVAKPNQPPAPSAPSATSSAKTNPKPGPGRGADYM